MRRSRRPQGRPDALRAIGRPATQALMQACVRARAAGRTASAAMATNEIYDMQVGMLASSYGIVLKPGHDASCLGHNATPCSRSLGACVHGACEQLSLAVSRSNPNMAMAGRRCTAVSTRPFASGRSEERLRGAGTRISQSDRFAAFRFDQQWTS